MQRHITNRKAAHAGETTSTAPPSEGEFIDEVELLRRIPVSRRTLFGWRISGKIPYIKLTGRRVLFDWESVRQALLRAQKEHAMTRDLPPFLRELLDAPPRAGEGVHHWLFRVARQLHAHLPAGEIVALLETRVANCGRHVSRNEIEDAVKNSIGCAGQSSGQPASQPTKSKWPTVNQEQRTAIIRDGGGLVDLWEISPVRIEDSDQHTEEIIDQLFPGNPFLCCGKSNSDFDTRPREEWRGELAQLQLIVPSPMTARTGLTKDGRESKHTLDNTGSRRFLVCEFDKGTTDEHSAWLIHLAGYAPLVCAVHSGGKSLHGWFYVQGQPEERVLKFFRYAVSLGADSRLWTRSQFCRMPDGVRDNDKRQTVFCLSFKPLRRTQ